jgi:hypothetical protein
MSRLCFSLLVAGLLVRLGGLPLWGTFDTEVWKSWALRAATDGLADVYGPSDRELFALARQSGPGVFPTIALMPFPATTVRWGTAEWAVNYPPGSMLTFWAAGKLYLAFDATGRRRRLFNAAVNLPPVLASVAIAFILARTAPAGLRWTRALAFWLNPAIVLAVPILGYQDTLFGAFGLLAVIAMMRARLSLATALVVTAGLFKPQGILLVPTLVVLLARTGRLQDLGRSALAGLAAAAALLAPWWLQGHLLSALDSVRRIGGQVMIAPQAYNLWWLAGYAVQWPTEGPWPAARMVARDEFQAAAGWDAVTIALLLVGVATAANAFVLARWPRGSVVAIPLSVVLQVHLYALLAPGVHENHTALAAILAPLLLGIWPRARAALTAISAFLFLNLFLTAGFGRRLTRLAWLAEAKRLPGIDLSVLVALFHVVLVVVLAVWTIQSLSAARRAEAPAS